MSLNLLLHIPYIAKERLDCRRNLVKLYLELTCNLRKRAVRGFTMLAGFFLLSTLQSAGSLPKRFPLK